MHLTDLFPNTFAAVRQQLARDTQPKRVLIKDMLAYDSEQKARQIDLVDYLFSSP